MADQQSEFEYDVALSFAGEDRGYVQPIAQRLRDAGAKVFYDEFQKSAMWGEDLIVFFDEIFRKKARYAVVFISRPYVDKHWPTHESRSAQARALIQDATYLLPVRLDGAELPGLQPTIGFIDARETGREGLIELILEKILVSHPIDAVPRTAADEALLLNTRPGGWEFLYFGAVLLRERVALEPKWRDHDVGYAKLHGTALNRSEAWALIRRIPTEATTIVGNINRMFEPVVTEQAFGLPGEPGDADRIEHFAQRVLSVYEDLIDWSTRLRGTPVPDDYEGLLAAAIRFVEDPIRQIREFVESVVKQADQIPAHLRESRDESEKLEMNFTLTLTVADEIMTSYEGELATLETVISWPPDAGWS
jgi:hypothetical protein